MAATFLTALLGCFVAWIAATVLGEPVYRFLQLRLDAARTIARFDPYAAEGGNKNPDAGSADWIAQRKPPYNTCGIDLQAFAATHPYISFILRWLGYHPDRAGLALAAMGNMPPTDPNKAGQRDDVAQSLCLDFE